MQKQGLTQVGLATHLGVTQPTISRYLTGQIPRADDFLKLIKLLNVESHWLLGWDEERQRLEREFKALERVTEALGGTEQEMQDRFTDLSPLVTGLGDNLDQLQELIGEAHAVGARMANKLAELRTTEQALRRALTLDEPRTSVPPVSSAPGTDTAAAPEKSARELKPARRPVPVRGTRAN